MPYAFETDRKRIPRVKDKRVKLTEEQREEIRNNDLGLSQRALAAEYGVSRRTIQFTQNPEKLEQNRRRRVDRGGWRQYYDKDKHAESMKAYRKGKKKLSDENMLV